MTEYVIYRKYVVYQMPLSPTFFINCSVVESIRLFFNSWAYAIVAVGKKHHNGDVDKSIVLVVGY